MAESKAAVQTAQAAKGSAKMNDVRLLGKLVKLWTIHNTRSLEVRLETGSLLNARLGQPTERQPRNQSVLKQAADTLRIAASELYRMRWFEYFSKDEESCWGEIPLASRSWTKFKERLPILIAALKGNEKPQSSSGDKKKTAVVDGLLRLIDSATSKSRTENFTVDGAKREELIKGLQELVSAVSNVVGVRFRLLETEENGSGGLTQTIAAPVYETGLTLSQCPLDAAAVLA